MMLEIRANRNFIQVRLNDESVGLYELMPGEPQGERAYLREVMEGDAYHDKIENRIEGYFEGIADYCEWSLFTVDQSDLEDVFENSNSLSCMEDMDDLSIDELDPKLVLEIFSEHCLLFEQTDSTNQSFDSY